MAIYPERVSPYRTVLMDPPWNEQGGGKVKRGADRHYPLMKRHGILEAVLCCPLWQGVADNAHLYMWVTNNFLEDGLWLMDALNFRYKTNFVWTKAGAQGLGQYFRGMHELCLFGTKGKKPTEPRTEARNIGSHLDAPRRAHSQKPEASYNLIERRSKGPYLELFARDRRDGWATWGNELHPLRGGPSTQELLGGG
jgi:N6-adenosine-specific RNA methylase IME4